MGLRQSLSIAASVSIFTISATWLSAPAFAKDPPVKAKVTLRPLGSFEATTSAVIGRGKKNGDTFEAQEIKVPVATLKTGMSLRDSHLKDYLKAKEYKFITARNIKASKGKGTAEIEVKGIKKPVNFVFKDLGGNKAQANFKINLKDFDISGISYQGVGVQDIVEIIATVPYQ